MRRADRLLRIVHFLRSRRSAVTAQAIADEFAICRRTVYRDIRDLVYSGAPSWRVSFSDLRESIRHRQKVRIIYTDDQKRETQRTLRPLALVFLVRYGCW